MGLLNVFLAIFVLATLLMLTAEGRRPQYGDNHRDWGNYKPYHKQKHRRPGKKVVHGDNNNDWINQRPRPSNNQNPPSNEGPIQGGGQLGWLEGWDGEIIETKRYFY